MSENESRETVADIIREKRKMAAEIRAHLSIVPARREEQLLEADSLDREADRIEAAAKRDEDHAVEHATRHAEAVARDNCRDCVHNPSGKNYEGGNAAAMREACQKTRDLLVRRGNGKCQCVLTWDEFNDAQKMLRAALSAPPRNCDKMPDIDNLTMHDLAKSPCKSTLECASREELLALVRWILAPAAERKGEEEARSEQ